ncbi:MAG: bifunctional alpha,alpha-trehalose-phosphate synthase (UDP-forming)/trehalose-phosphatase [Myxococcota bacterium]
MSRVLLVSNRLPIRINVGDGAATIERSSGGLATGLSGPHEASDGLWIGWPGDLDALSEQDRETALARLSELRLEPVALSAAELERYYDGYCNSVIWPLFHYLPAELPLEIRNFEEYRRVNERFAETVAKHYRDGDLIWVHDYQLMLVPELVRRRLPDARIGFFLHIPFPSSELFRTLPERDAILRGLLGADLIGFHTTAYMRHFASSLLLSLGVATEIDRLNWRGRSVRLGCFGMGIDARAYDETARDAAVLARVSEIRGEDKAQILLGIDRLDYTKGIPRRLLAFERLLHAHPELRGRVRLVQVAVPSREDVRAYRAFRSLTDELIGRIHGQFATPSWVPVHWLYRSLPREEIVALYRAADVMLVTPLRDGMNLVAKEFVASRADEDGVLVLSEFAGAAAELAEAISVNPFDIEATAEAIHRALTLGPEDRRARMRVLRTRVFAHDVERWVSGFLSVLRAEPERENRVRRTPTPEPVLEELAQHIRAAPRRVLLLDYDGTLVPFARTPEGAAPDLELRALLTRLTREPGCEVHIVSGRGRGLIEEWLEGIDLGLHLEHGLWSRLHGSNEWTSLAAQQLSWRDAVREILWDFTSRTPGSLIEEKSASFAWHYRGADPEFGSMQAKELRLHLSERLSNVPVEIIPGEMVVEVRPHGVNKGRVVGRVLTGDASDALVVALGDDRTDEDLFAALPESGVSIHVGTSASRARYRIEGVARAREFLRALHG